MNAKRILSGAAAAGSFTAMFLAANVADADKANASFPQFVVVAGMVTGLFTACYAAWGPWGPEKRETTADQSSAPALENI